MDAEADLMIALEALKNELTQVKDKLSRVQRTIRNTKYDVLANRGEIFENTENITNICGSYRQRVDDLIGKCHECESHLVDNRSALILYCQ